MKILSCKLNIDMCQESTKPFTTAEIIIFNEYISSTFKAVLSFNDIQGLLYGNGIVKCVDGSMINASELFCPGRQNDLAWVISAICNAALYSGEITSQEYISFVRKHYEAYYMQKYQSRRKMCMDFYHRYFWMKSKVKYPFYEYMLEAYKDLIEEKGQHIYLRRGGKRIGWYTDEYERHRPITSRVSYERIVPVAEKLWVCFLEEHAA